MCTWCKNSCMCEAYELKMTSFWRACKAIYIALQDVVSHGPWSFSVNSLLSLTGCRDPRLSSFLSFLSPAYAELFACLTDLLRQFSLQWEYRYRYGNLSTFYGGPAVQCFAARILHCERFTLFTGQQMRSSTVHPWQRHSSNIYGV